MTVREPVGPEPRIRADGAPDTDHEPARPASGVGPAPSRRPAPRSFFAQLRHRGQAGAADYVFQILIVVIGVFLGITFESKASERERTRKAHAALDQLAAELQRDVLDMDRVIEHQRGQEQDFSEIASWLTNATESASERVDSLLEKVVTSLTVYPRRGTYTSMIAAGQIALLPAELRTPIVDLYENVYTRLAANGTNFDNSLERDYLPAYADSWDPARRALISTDAAQRVRFRNHLTLMAMWSAYYRDLVAQSRINAQAVLGEIEQVRPESRP